MIAAVWKTPPPTLGLLLAIRRSWTLDFSLQVLQSAFDEGGWTDSARLRTGHRTGSTSENACKHWLRTGSRVKSPETPIPLSSAFKVQNSPANGNPFLRIFARFCHPLSSFHFPFPQSSLHRTYPLPSAAIRSDPRSVARKLFSKNNGPPPSVSCLPFVPFTLPLPRKATEASARTPPPLHDIREQLNTLSPCESTSIKPNQT
jgi:hypothetical protein